MTTRYYSLTACEHGEWNVHATEPGILKEDGSLDRDKVCLGGRRRECEAGQIIWWCENHEASAASDGWFADELHCHVWWWGEAHPETPLLDPYDCSMTSRLLVDPPGERDR